MECEGNIAHVKTCDNNKKIQTVKEHCENTAKYAAANLACVNLYNLGFLCGLIHDMGKSTRKFSDYIWRSANDEKVVKGSVNHTFCGVIYVLEHFHDSKSTEDEKLLAEIISYAVGAHHGLFDCVDLHDGNGFEHRLNKSKDEIYYEEATENYFENVVDESEIFDYFNKSFTEFLEFKSRIIQDCKSEFYGDKSSENESKSFLFGMLSRLLLSALIDGDRRDTAEFMGDVKILDEQDDQNKKEFWDSQLSYFNDTITDFKPDTPINKSRIAISEKCENFDTGANGVFTISVPTGAGKTISCLRFALEKAEKYDKNRVIFIIPLLSVLEQNADVIKERIKDKSAVLEHHSNIILDRKNTDELDKYELLTQTWDSKIVISTLVQLLNMLFNHKTTDIRRMNSLCNSVIVIDEVQSLPDNITHIFNMAMNFVAYYCNSIVLLSSATQPCFDKVKFPLRLSQNSDIVPFDQQLFEPFKRVDVIDKTRPHQYSCENIVDDVMYMMSEISSVLIICNAKASAKKIFVEINQRNKDENIKVFHLSNSMCMAHRIDTLKALKENLSNSYNKDSNIKVICVSTQIIEAGVDISFESVIRLIAGIDNIAQSAGRCNRNNEFGQISNVYIYNLNSEHENVQFLKEIKAAQDCTKRLLYGYSKKPEKYKNDLLSNESINQYYGGYMQLRKSQLSYPVTFFGTQYSLFSMLSANTLNTSSSHVSDGYTLCQSFKTAAEEFNVFDENTIDVIVPYNEHAEKIIADLVSARASFDIAYLKGRIKDAKPYVISIYQHQLKSLEDKGMIEDRVLFKSLNKLCYHDKTGLSDNDYDLNF